MLLASSFAVHHASEHIDLGQSNPNFSSVGQFHIDHADHDEGRTVSELAIPLDAHSIESLCDACLVLSNLSAGSVAGLFFDFLSTKSTYYLSNLVQFKSDTLHSYHSRAPPGQA